MIDFPASCLSTNTHDMRAHHRFVFGPPRLVPVRVERQHLFPNRIHQLPSGITNRAANTCVVPSPLRLLDHISHLPSGENTGSTSAPGVNVTRVLRVPSSRVRNSS